MNWPSLTQTRPWRGDLGEVQPSNGLLRRYRRSFALLAAQLVFGIVRPESAASILKEGRNPAPAPKSPDSPGDWVSLPKEVTPTSRTAFHHEHCGFDWSWIDKIKPNEVWWMPVERCLIRVPGQKFKNFPEGEARLTNGV